LFKEELTSKLLAIVRNISLLNWYYSRCYANSYWKSNIQGEKRIVTEGVLLLYIHRTVVVVGGGGGGVVVVVVVAALTE
jgi:hypothetical protein